MISIRPVRPSDIDALYAISLATGDAGRDAGPLHDDPRLIGHIYSAPYAQLATDLAFVAEDADGVAGFVVGAVDTENWAQRLESEWWPWLRALYANPSAPRKPADTARIKAIFHPEETPPEVIAQFPAHMHMNLAPRARGQGTGRALLETWLSAARSKGARAVHIGASPQNQGGIAFWRKCGFGDINGAPRTRTIWLGRAI